MAPKTGSSTMVAADRTRTRDSDDAMDASEDAPVTQETRCRADDPHLAFLVDKEKTKGHKQWRSPGMKAHWGAGNTHPMERGESA